MNKHLMVILLLLVTVLSYSSKTKKIDFSGDWSFSDDFRYFQITLNQYNDKITGFHSGGTNDGMRIDDSTGNDLPSIEGYVKGKKAYITIQSSYSDALHEVEITWIDQKTVLWVIKKYGDGETYIPSDVKLTRQTDEKKSGN